MLRFAVLILGTLCESSEPPLAVAPEAVAHASAPEFNGGERTRFARRGPLRAIADAVQERRPRFGQSWRHRFR